MAVQPIEWEADAIEDDPLRLIFTIVPDGDSYVAYAIGVDVYRYSGTRDMH